MATIIVSDEVRDELKKKSVDIKVSMQKMAEKFIEDGLAKFKE